MRLSCRPCFCKDWALFGRGTTWDGWRGDLLFKVTVLGGFDEGETRLMIGVLGHVLH
jgi:hypothetical protein